jgi:t-SNARE complex subunit (syntaxin)
MARREVYNRPNPWRRSVKDDRAARNEAIVSFVATLIVVLVLVAITVWFFFFADTPGQTPSSFL